MRIMPFVKQTDRSNRVYNFMCVIKYLRNIIEPTNNFTCQINWLFIQYLTIDKTCLELLRMLGNGKVSKDHRSATRYSATVENHTMHSRRK